MNRTLLHEKTQYGITQFSVSVRRIILKNAKICSLVTAEKKTILLY